MSDSYKPRKELEAKLRNLQEITAPQLMGMIADYDANQAAPTFEGGSATLVEWYESRIEVSQG